MSKKINWFSAPAVPTHILQAAAVGEEINGKIVSGPSGQKTFVSSGPSQLSKKTVYTGVVHSHGTDA